jgi:dihydroorotate dehydrogenase
MWYQALRPALFALDPERAHKLALQALRTFGWRALRTPVGAPVELMGLRFPNRVGLAAGFDKNAVAVDGLGALGFGFIEVGTVTPRAQPGQRRPRLFRLPAEGALINRLGFPNDGAAKVAARLRHRRYRGILGVNIGKNAATPISRAIDDYVSCMRMVQPVADYVAVNVSSPNTVGLRELQQREHLEPLLTALLQERAVHSQSREHYLPLLVKIAPDLSTAQVQDVASLLMDLAVDGVIATNTTVASLQTGGISGRPLHPLALSTVTRLRAALGPAFPIIGVGGIDSPKAAVAMRAAGADLVQIYTGLIYKGPMLISQCVRGLG